MPVTKSHQRTGSQVLKANPEKESDEDQWYSGMLSAFFTNPVEERDINGLAQVNLGGHQESRDGIEDDASTVDETVRGLADDMKSLPSVQDEILPEEEEEDSLMSSLDKLSLKKDEKSQLSAFEKLRASVKKEKESVESVVEKKIKNLSSENNNVNDISTLPHLRNKIFPKTSGRQTEETGDQKPPSSILDARRLMLVSELRQAVDTYGRFDQRCANITAALGDLYEENKEYAEAIRLHRDAVSVYSVKLGDDHQTTMQAKMRLAKVQENAGEYDDAISTYFYVMNMSKALLGEKDPKVADIMVNISDTLCKQGQHELAIKTLKRALKTFRDVLDDSHPKVSSTVDGIASLYLIIGDFSKASAILEEVVKLKAATLGAESKEVAVSLSQLASCYECAEEYDQAMNSLKKAYKIYIDADGESGEFSILTLERVALVYQATKQFKKAAIAYLGVLRGRKRNLGESHPTVADTYFHLGVSLRESGQKEKAFKCMKQALNIYVGEGKDMHDVEMIAETMHELALIHKSRREMTDAMKTFKQELSVRRKLDQPEYPLIARSLYQLGTIELELKNNGKALSYCNEALSIYERVGETSNVDYAEALYTTGMVFQSLRKKQRCYDTFLKAACIFKKEGYNEEHPHFVTTVNMLKKLGHNCKCKRKTCSSIPCQTILHR